MELVMTTDWHPTEPQVAFGAVRPLAVATAVCLIGITACTESPQYQKPPTMLPYETRLAGGQIETRVRVVEHANYRIGFKLGYMDGDEADRRRAARLAGDPQRDSAWQLMRPGTPISFQIRISSFNPSSFEGVVNKSILEEQMNGCSAQCCYANVTDVRIKPGVYRIAIENVKDFPDFQGTNVTFLIAADPKGDPIAGYLSSPRTDS